MKRALLAILGVIALYFVGRTIYVGLASDETKIRWLLQAEQVSFNDPEIKATYALPI